MNNFKKLVIGSVTTFVFAGNVLAQENTINKEAISNEIASNIQFAMADIKQPTIENVAKLQLDQMTFKQNVEQFLQIAKYNEETKSVKTQIISE